MFTLLFFLLLLLLEQTQCKFHSRQLRQTLPKVDCLSKTSLAKISIYSFLGSQGLKWREVTFSCQDFNATLRPLTRSNFWPWSSLPCQPRLHICISQWSRVFHPLDWVVFLEGWIWTSRRVAPANLAFCPGWFFLRTSNLVLLLKRYVPEYRQRNTYQIPFHPLSSH